MKRFLLIIVFSCGAYGMEKKGDEGWSRKIDNNASSGRHWSQITPDQEYEENVNQPLNQVEESEKSKKKYISECLSILKEKKQKKN